MTAISDSSRIFALKDQKDQCRAELDPQNLDSLWPVNLGSLLKNFLLFLFPNPRQLCGFSPNQSHTLIFVKTTYFLHSPGPEPSISYIVQA